MLISDKQQQANRLNAQQSCGPKTQEGKAAVRLNALTYGLRARNMLLPNEDPEEYKQLWAGIEAEWQPQTCTERLYLEQMSTSQWLLARITKSERRIYEHKAGDDPEKYYTLLQFVAKQRAQLERSFRTAAADLKQLQKERPARQAQPAKTSGPHPQAPSPGERSSPTAPPADYVMSESAEAHPVFCSPTTPDSR